MSKSKNCETKRTGTKDGMVSFGHIHPDQVKSSVMIQGQESLEYIAIDQTAPRKRWMTSRCRGRYQVGCGDDIPKDQVGFWVNAESSDILIQTKGRIRMEAENIDLIARGPDASKGVINIQSNESVNIETKKFTANASESISLFTDGEMQQTAINIMKIVAGSVQKMTSMSAIKPPTLSILNDIVQYAIPFPIV
jgi:hypothetical protein